MTDTITFRTNQNFDNWRKRLAGEKVPTHEADPDIGYYRARKKDLATNQVWWTPGAYFIDGGKLVGVIGERNMTEREIGDLWTFVCQYPIPEQVFFDFEGRVEVPNDEWPAGLRGEPKRPAFAKANMDTGDLYAATVGAKSVPAANREVERSDNLPPEVSPVEEHQAAINNAIAAAPKAVPKTAEECALVEGSKNRIAELRLQAEKIRKAAIAPHLAEQQRINGLWMPAVNAATAEEKALGDLVKMYRENERKRIAKEQADAAAKQAAIDEANARAADRAIAAGKPEPAPVVVEAPAPAAPVAVTPTYGKRTTKADLKIILDHIYSYDEVYLYFKDTDAVKACLTALATKAVADGRSVPGTKVRTGLI